MKLTDLQAFAQFRTAPDVKVLRHRDDSVDLWALRRAGTFHAYQNRQGWDVFGKARIIVSFIAERNRFARFVGVWEVLGKRRTGRQHRYSTRELPGFTDVEGRLIVRWGEGTRSWAQWLRGPGDKEIVELLPPNYVKDFPGYYNFTLTYDELKMMIANPDSNREWQRMLSSVSGVYVILDQESGRQYVGSAVGAGGFWRRWETYAASASGGNVLLRKLLREHPDRSSRFQFSILRVLEPGVQRDEVLGHEALIKRKLGSRAFGLNLN